MTPSRLRLHFRLNRVCSLYDLTRCFNIDEHLMRDMLQIWIRKGKLLQKPRTEMCGSECAKCHPLMTEMYEWLNG